jgi:mRNA-binding protein PUF3
MAGQIWAMSQDPKGCREVQQAMERNPEPELLQNVGNEFVGHVAQAMRCPYANHVLQMYISVAKPEKLSFILDETMSCPGGVLFAAKHKFGCRIVQRLVERLLPVEADELAEAILGDVLGLSRHPYGNYVLQNLIEHGTSNQRAQLAQEIQRGIVPICQDHFGSAVVSSALSKMTREDMLPVAHSILHASGLLVFLAHSRHGHTTVRNILRSVEGAELSLARELLQAEVASLQASRYGRTVVGWLEESCPAT